MDQLAVTVGRSVFGSWDAVNPGQNPGTQQSADDISPKIDCHMTRPNGAVEEHDGTIYAQDADAFGPFSIPQWVVQRNASNDRRHNTVLHSLGGVPPLTSMGTLNPVYPNKRELYNVALLSAVSDGQGGPGTDLRLTNLLAARAGSTPQLCQSSSTILSFGFALLTSAPLGHTCGQVATNLRAFLTL